MPAEVCLPPVVIQLPFVPKNPEEGVLADQHSPQADADAVHICLSLVVSGSDPDRLEEGGQLFQGHVVRCAAVCTACAALKQKHMWQRGLCNDMVAGS